MGGGRIPIAEHDEGLRYLGFWIDACSDWGNQLIHLQEKARRFRAAVEPAGSTKPKRSDILIQCGTDTSDHVLSYDSSTGH